MSANIVPSDHLPSVSVSPSAGDTINEDGFVRLQGDNAMEPGTYWRAIKTLLTSLEAVDADVHKSARGTLVHRGDVHLLMEVHFVLDEPHSVEVLEHPRNGRRDRLNTFRIPVDTFLGTFEPCHDAERVRQVEQQEVMARIQEVQQVLLEATANPMAVPDIQKAAAAALKELEEAEERQAMASSAKASEKVENLAKIHRRAARRSQAAGNPLAVRKVVLTNSLSSMIEQGVTADALNDLSHEAKRRTVIAETAGNYLANQTRRMTEIMEDLAPYYAERAQIAIAKSKGAIARSKSLHAGLQSLRLYTGDGSNVIELRSGKAACSAEPLTLYQSKRFMDEEVCLYLDIDTRFSYLDEALFFEEIKTNDALLNQVIPAPRGVVSMATTQRREIPGMHKMSAREIDAMMRANQSVFLLVRNGENLHVVYSGEPSHEFTHRLFPSNTDIQKPFVGLSGEKLKLEDLRYVEASDEFEAQALHYRRFLILLCGLDHRLRLFGDFYPPEKGLSFMSQDFQSRYFRFVEDEWDSGLIGDGLADVHVWLKERNANIATGSRVVCKSKLALQNCSGYLRLRSHHTIRLKDDHIGHESSIKSVKRDADGHYVEINARNTEAGKDVAFRCRITSDQKWILCMDTVLLRDVERYLASRNARSQLGILTVQLLQVARRVLKAEAVTQAPLRQYLRQCVLDANLWPEDGLDDRVALAINTWRAANKGADAPDVSEAEQIQQILDLLYPADKVVDSLSAMVERLCEQMGREPLELLQAPDRLILYATSTAEEVAEVQGCMEWGWCERLSLEKKVPKRGADRGVVQLKVIGQSRVWRRKGQPMAAGEVPMKAWALNETSLREADEPVKFKNLTRFLDEMRAWAGFEGVLRQGRARMQALADHERMRRAQPDAEHPLPAAAAAVHMDLASLAEDTQRVIKADFDRFLRSIPSASSYGYLWAQSHIPLAVHQSQKDGPLTFVYARVSWTQMARGLGDAEMLNTIESVFKQHRMLSTYRRVLNNLRDWSFSLVSSHECSGKQEWKLWKLSILKNTQKRGGSKRFRGHKGDGKPSHDWISVTLSFNRSFQRAFVGWSADVRAHNTHQDDEAKRHAMRPWKDSKHYTRTPYVSLKPARFCASPLVWSQEKNRSQANALFMKDNTQ